MRVWDVSPGYLSRQRLLGEHRELHGLYAILTLGKTGYSRHPETLRWKGALTGLVWRHAHLVSEMRLRGYTDATPLRPGGRVRWPARFITEPAAQLALLQAKYRDGESGRLAFPRNAQQLWAQHKYSCLARDPNAYRAFGRAVAAAGKRARFDDLVTALVLMLRARPSAGGVVNALEHMWGYVADSATAEDRRVAAASPAGLLAATQALAVRVGEPFLLASTALGELGAYVDR